jgi:uncharacterized membrane protein
VNESTNTNRIKQWLMVAFLGLILFAIIGLAISTWGRIEAGPVASVVTVLIVLTGAAVVAVELGQALVAFGVLLTCGLSEVIGVFTGLPFGRYEYTDRWWPTVMLGGKHHYPLLIPFAWLLILGGAYQIARTRFNRWQSVPVCAIITTLIDIPLERAMTTMFGYWKWDRVGPIFGAPVMNSVGASILAIPDRQLGGNVSQKVLMVFCGFVAVTGLIHGFNWAWVILGIIPVLLKSAAK